MYYMYIYIYIYICDKLLLLKVKHKLIFAELC
jgi:hypothetical protein